MFWSIFLNSLALIVAILAVGWIFATISDRRKAGDSDG
jgi:hypothetical protein